MISMETVIARRHTGFSDIGFENGQFYFASFVGNVPELRGDYLRLDESDYPCYGMSVMVVCLSNQQRQAATLIEKLCAGNPWRLVEWVMDAGRMTEHVDCGQRWKDYGVNFGVRYSDIGQCEWTALANKYREALCK